nr:DNA primase [uncultured Mediterranean phage uvMED]
MTQQSKFLHHSPCENCGSRDNVAVYDDHTFCFGCQQYKKTNGDLPRVQKKTNFKMIEGICEALPSRKIDSETCQKFNYQTGTYKGKPVHIANYYDKNFSVTAQHLRFADKSFIWIGDTNKISLFGQNLWRDGGKTVIITEGEIDCLSVSKVQNNRYPVVSVPSGATSAKKYIKRELEWLSKFENIVLMFDQDEAGRQATIDCANILPVKKVKIASLPAKDPNELLQKGQATKLYDAIWEAKAYTPQGIVEGSQTKELLLKDDYVETIPYHWNGLNQKLGGIRNGELTLLCAGSGTGKSQVCRELAHHLINKKIKVGYIALEENVKRSIRGIVGIGLNKLIHVPEVKKDIPEKEIVAEWERIKDYICFYDHFGSSDTEDLMNRIRYMVQALDCQVIFLDHISIVISGLADGDERRLIDNTMTSLRKLVEEVKCSMFVVSHLKRPEGKNGHEEGVQTSLSHLRGSHSLAQLSDAVIGFERDQQDETQSNVMTARVLKNRFTGDTGIACDLIYNKDTGRLSEGNFDE